MILYVVSSNIIADDSIGFYSEYRHCSRSDEQVIGIISYQGVTSQESFNLISVLIRLYEHNCYDARIDVVPLSRGPRGSSDFECKIFSEYLYLDTICFHICLSAE